MLFEAGNADDLEGKIRYLLETPGILENYTENCRRVAFETPDTYYQKLMQIYRNQNEDL